MFRIERTSPTNKDYQLLVQLLDEDLAIRNGESQTFYTQFNSSDSIREAVVGYADNEPVASGAFKIYQPGIAEVKRMFVKNEHRGKGYAWKLLQEIEVWAKECGYHTLILETGVKQQEAIRLYTRCHYQIMANYGQYEGVEDSVCMQKNL